MLSSTAGVRAVVAGLSAVALTALSGCAGGPEPSAVPAAGPTSVSSGPYVANLSLHPTRFGTPGPGYPTPTAPPPPEGTFTPSPGAWSGVQPSAGFRVTLVVPAHDPQAAVLAAAVRNWAHEQSARLTDIEVARPGQNLVDLSRALRGAPDLLVTAGDSLIDAVALVSPTAPGTRFLVLGGEVAEPTSNVTAVDWYGAGFRGEGLGQPLTHDPATFTPARAADAIRAGVAAVLTNWSGFVVWLE